MKILSAQTDLGNATSVSNASVVRVFNSDSSNLLVTRKTSGGTTIGSFMVPTGEAVYCEKDYTDTLESSAAVKASKTAFSPMMSFVSQDSAGPTYTYSVSSTSLDEGDSFTTTVTTTNVANGTVLYWELSGTNITSNDFSSGALTGSGTISNNTFNFSHTVSLDATTEGAETILVKVYSDSGRNTQVGNTVNVNVADTSLTRTYTTSLSVTTADEGDTFTTTMTTTNVANGTVLYWELSGTNIASGDFSSGSLTGSGTISSNTFNFSHTIAEDNSTEGTETVSIIFYSDSGRNTQVGSTATVTINDTSVTASNYSVAFDGTNDRLEIADNTDFEFGSGDFTVEAWVKQPNQAGSGASSSTIVNKWHNTSGAKEWILRIDNGSGNNNLQWIQTQDGNSNQFTTGNTALANDTWYHVAAVGDSGTIKLFVNGTQQSNTGTQGTINAYSNPLYFGYNLSSNGQWMDGKISNARITKGQALYTSSFTAPTTPLTTTSQSATASNVKLLCCNKESVTGSTVVPDGLSDNGDPGTGTATIGGTASTPYVDFDDDDGLNGAADSNLNIGTGEFTIEYWVYLDDAPGTGAPSYARMFQLDGPSGNSDKKNLQITINPNTKAVQVWAYDGSIAVTIGSSTNMLNAWHHVAVVRDSNQLMTVFIDGTSEGTQSNVTQSFDPNSGSPRVRIGSYDNGATNGVFNGKISNLRVLVGTALYTSNFTAPTPPLTNITNTKLLCCQTSGSTTTAAVGPSSLVNSGCTSSTDNPFITTGGAVDFNGGGYNSGGESLAISSDSSLDLGSGSFTIEAWVKMDSTQGTSWNVLACSSGYLTGTGVRSWNIYVYGTAGLRIYDSSGGPGENWTMVYGNDSLFNNSSWTHIAWTRSVNGNNTSNNNNTVWINGVGQGSFSNRDNSYSDGQNLYIGSSDYSQNGNIDEYGFDGAISNFRFTKGQVLYTSNFTPSTSSLTTTSQGATASNVSVLGLQHPSTLTSFAKSPSTPTVTGTPTVTTGPF